MENELSHKIICAAIEVQRVLGGPGLLESVYEAALCHELTLQGLHVQRQVPVPVIYKNVKIKETMYIDILVNDCVLIEVKATDTNHQIFFNQITTYLKLRQIKLGLLINFGIFPVTDSIKRIVNGL